MVETAIENHLAFWLKNATDGDTSNSARQTARSAVIATVSGNIFSGRRPPDQVGRALTMRRLTTDRWNDNSGESDLVRPIVTIEGWGKGDSAPFDIPKLMEQLRRALTHYRGVMTDAATNQAFVHNVAIVRDAMPLPSSPRDKETKAGWTFRSSMDVQLVHDQMEI